MKVRTHLLYSCNFITGELVLEAGWGVPINRDEGESE